MFHKYKQIEQVDEPPWASSAILVFEQECYSEALILLGAELMAIVSASGNCWHHVAEIIEASEKFARQNAEKNCFSVSNMGH